MRLAIPLNTRSLQGSSLVGAAVKTWVCPAPSARRHRSPEARLSSRENPLKRIGPLAHISTRAKFDCEHI